MSSAQSPYLQLPARKAELQALCCNSIFSVTALSEVEFTLMATVFNDVYLQEQALA